MISEIILQPVMSLQAQLLAQLHQESFGDAAWSLEQIKGSLTLESTDGWMAYSGDNLAGFIIYQVSIPQSEILTFCVRPCFRRHGIGEKLVQRAIEANRTQGCSRLFLDVAATNRAALALYQKCGFVQTGKRPHYYHRADGDIDAIVLTLTLNPT